MLEAEIAAHGWIEAISATTTDAPGLLSASNYHRCHLFWPTC